MRDQKAERQEILRKLLEHLRRSQKQSWYQEALATARHANHRRLRYRPEPKPVPYNEFPEGF